MLKEAESIVWDTYVLKISQNLFYSQVNNNQHVCHSQNVIMFLKREIHKNGGIFLSFDKNGETIVGYVSEWWSCFTPLKMKEAWEALWARDQETSTSFSCCL